MAEEKRDGPISTQPASVCCLREKKRAEEFLREALAINPRAVMAELALISRTLCGELAPPKASASPG